MSENEGRVKLKFKITIIDENNAEEKPFADNEKEGGWYKVTLFLLSVIF